MMHDSIEIDDNDENLIVLKETLDEMSDLLDFTSDSAFQQIQMEWIGNKTYLIQGQALDAARHTLSSIWGCCKHACFSDAFTLVRKFRDDLVQYLFVISTLNGIEGLSEEEAEKYLNDITDTDKVTEGLNLLLEIISSGRKKKPHEKAVDSWLDNTLSDDAHFQDRRLYFDASKYIFLLKNDDTIKNCFELYLKPLWSTLDRELNNYVHANGIKYVMSNLPNYIYDRRKDIIVHLVSAIRGIMVIFISLIILIKPLSIQSCDYINYLDIGETPPEGSEYWVASIIQNFIDADIARVSSGLKQFLKENNKYSMQI
ncbi:hypothetical protein DesyoDRAFT_1561 [Desulfosporosinus youngiae DSM 17734]|uniref:Uncharacterized protein n=2 Tax=Desulfosporosinus TaxID=79206 RepID=H5Y2K8_9FIRM|nr:hypothetical protein DesyoDRAFT_1561 [Desulfosporosinus youngiae DSM 17734]